MAVFLFFIQNCTLTLYLYIKHTTNVRGEAQAHPLALGASDIMHAGHCQVETSVRPGQ